MRRTLLLGLSVAVLIALVAPAAVAAEPQLDGVYVSRDGGASRSLVEVARHGDSFVVVWMIPYSDGETLLLVPVAVGVGIVDGDIFAVSYYSSRTSRLVLYRIEEGGQRLAGRSVTIGGDGGEDAETLSKIPAEVVEPRPPKPSEEAKPREPATSGWPAATAPSGV